MTRLAAPERCDSCGGLLVPPELASAPVRHEADYVCFVCGRPYSWVGNPPRWITAISPKRSDD